MTSQRASSGGSQGASLGWFGIYPISGHDGEE